MNTPRLDLGPVTVYFGEKNGKYPDGNQVVVRGREATALFDLPLSARRLAPEQLRADMVILGHVHEDHMAGLGCVPHLPVHAPRQELEVLQSVQGFLNHYGHQGSRATEMTAKLEQEFHYAPRPDAMPYEDGALWDLGGVTVRAVHMPGHTCGHMVLMVEPHGIAFIGDIDLTGFGPFYGDVCSDLKAFQDSLKKVARLEASAWITYHHKGVIQHRETFLELLGAFEQKIILREQAILDFLRLNKGGTLAQMVEKRFVYPPDFKDVFVETVERKTISDHLARLLEQERVLENEGVYQSV